MCICSYHRCVHIWYCIDACPNNIHGTTAPKNNSPTPGHTAKRHPQTKNEVRFAGPGPRKLAMCLFSDSILQPVFSHDCTAWL